METIAVIALIAFITGLVLIVKTLNKIHAELKKKPDPVVTPIPSSDEPSPPKKRTPARRRKARPRVEEPAIGSEAPPTKTEEVDLSTEKKGDKDAPATI